MLKIFTGEQGYESFKRNKAVYDANETLKDWEHLVEIIDYSDDEITVGEFRGYAVALEK